MSSTAGVRTVLMEAGGVYLADLAPGIEQFLSYKSTV